MVRFMIATFTDLILRVGIAAVLSATALGSTGIWMAWPVLVHRYGAFHGVLRHRHPQGTGRAVGCCRGRGTAAEVRAEAEFAADARWRPCNHFATCEFVSCHR